MKTKTTWTRIRQRIARVLRLLATKIEGVSLNSYCLRLDETSVNCYIERNERYIADLEWTVYSEDILNRLRAKHGRGSELKTKVSRPAHQVILPARCDDE